MCHTQERSKTITYSTSILNTCPNHENLQHAGQVYDRQDSKQERGNILMGISACTCPICSNHQIRSQIRCQQPGIAHHRMHASLNKPQP